MNITVTPRVEQVLLDHAKLVRKLQYPQAKSLINDALIACYEQSPISLDIAVLLDELALNCKELEQFDEAAVLLSQSLAIKKLLFGPEHAETLVAKRRLAACVREDRSAERKIHDILNEFLGDIKTRMKEQGIDDVVPDEPKLVRCLVIAQGPPSMYFGDMCSSRNSYTVTCEDGQIGLIAAKVTLELGQEILARPLRIYMGRLLLRFHEVLAAETISGKRISKR
jgi:hypothetical protein